MKIRELRQKSKPELQKLSDEKRNRLLDLRFDLSEGRVKNIREMKSARKDIARVLTLLNEK
ncbi:MAG: 50S ribosomal protein L29 [Candidatus Spechtbacteria bacterium RIFCSPHIGHO2_02_FULL_43_15b]|uniref:Large ribosomal subunit protein uL29 n=1 Tax=Candidatus Spechtbacteria bacterium RIFCSPHIGHO2_01_FULL_43_30 TaxID=1802158 RepID=A0A1G2H8H4_9BACT|nr:MAG: 50S ribosomal protein L29 [Candidatus Spechtbacteria bacterium RIFCSPHIGHO2_01_FULL_43_30]OGZ59707.1 MAG: 50S ribosomal protein L29 [Candidatus Spechtbacteria bacterium RIFCSPHIGHO2_02_FULL_43_15b]